MKTGISVWSCPNDWTLEKVFEISHQAGFEGVEVALDEKGEINLSSTKEDMQNIKNSAKKHNIKLYSVATGLYWKYSLTSANKDIVQKAKSIVKKQLEIAKWLGCDTILVVPGSVGVDFIPNDEIVEYDVAYDRALTALNELKSYAEEMGVCIAIENVWNKFLLSPLEMRDFIDKINSKYVGAYLDVGNILYSGYPEHWIKILGNRIKKVHFKDFLRKVGNLSGFVDLLSGNVNYPLVVEKLKEIGYDDFVTAEVGFNKDYPVQSIYNTLNSMEKILNK